MLIVEDGSGKVDSQTYASVEDLRAYATLRAVDLPEDEADCEVLLIKAMDAVEASNFVGDKLTREQALQWPRYGAYVEEWPVPTNEIPRQLVQGQCALACEAQTIDLLPTTDANASGPITSETVGPITTAYANQGSVRRTPAVAKADVLLRTLIKRNGLVAVRT